jgi:hypothetical protein
LDISSCIVPIALFAWIYSLICERAHGGQLSQLPLYDVKKVNFERAGAGVKRKILEEGLASVRSCG